MTSAEVKVICDAVYENYQVGWEQTRFIAYVQAASAGAKINKPEDLIKFSWENSNAEIIPITKEELVKTQYELMAIMKKK
jgi:hypothetical protein